MDLYSDSLISAPPPHKFLCATPSKNPIVTFMGITSRFFLIGPLMGGFMDIFSEVSNYLGRLRKSPSTFIPKDDFISDEPNAPGHKDGKRAKEFHFLGP